MDDKLILKNHLREARTEKKLSQSQLAEMVGVTQSVPLKQGNSVLPQSWRLYYALHLTKSLKNYFIWIILEGDRQSFDLADHK